jgi:hypothetical protein
MPASVHYAVWTFNSLHASVNVIPLHPGKQLEFKSQCHLRVNETSAGNKMPSARDAKKSHMKLWDLNQDVKLHSCTFTSLFIFKN